MDYDVQVFGFSSHVCENFGYACYEFLLLFRGSSFPPFDNDYWQRDLTECTRFGVLKGVAFDVQC